MAVDERARPLDGGDDAANLNHEHDRVTRLHARIKLLEGVDGRAPQDLWLKKRDAAAWLAHLGLSPTNARRRPASGWLRRNNGNSHNLSTPRKEDAERGITRDRRGIDAGWFLKYSV